MNTWMVDAGTVMFMAYLEDERGENKQEAENVVSVELPKIELYKKQNVRIKSPVRILFSNAADMLKMVRAEETHMRVVAAAQVYNAIERKYEVESWIHLLTINRNGIAFSSGTVENASNTNAWCQFPVTAYKILKDEEEIFCEDAGNMMTYIKQKLCRLVPWRHIKGKG